MIDTDNPAALRSGKFDAGCDAITEFLRDALGAVSHLSPDELKVYGDAGHRFLQGWEFACDFDGAPIGIRVLVDQDFPFSAPRIGLAEPGSIDGAHIETGSLFCLPQGQTVAWDRPADALAVLLRQANDIIAKALNPETEREETRREFIAYWVRDNAGSLATSYIAPTGRSHKIFRIDDGTRSIRLFDNRADAQSFFQTGGKKLRPIQFGKPAYLVWLRRPPAMNEIPATIGDLVRLLLQDPIEGLDELTALVSKDRLTLILGLSDSDGHGFFGVELPKLTFQHDAPVKLPFVSARDRDQMLTRLRVRRADPEWVFGRDGNPHVTALRAARVALIGAGSLGSYLAQQLASAGVGTITIVDPEVLVFENTSRHILGAEAVGAPKAEALALRLQRQFRTSIITGTNARWQDWVETARDDLGDYDLILCSIGDWPQEVHLADFFQNNRTDSALLYAWLEPHAVASQAVILLGTSPCFCCGFDTKAEAARRMSDWDAATRRAVPLCGGQYQPYGAGALSGHAAAIAEFALRHLTGDIDGPAHLLRSAGDPAALGGRWQDWWIEECGGGDLNYRSRVLPWPKRDNCPMCGGV